MHFLEVPSANKLGEADKGLFRRRRRHYNNIDQNGCNSGDKAARQRIVGLYLLRRFFICISIDGNILGRFSHESRGRRGRRYSKGKNQAYPSDTEAGEEP